MYPRCPMAFPTLCLGAKGGCQVPQPCLAEQHPLRPFSLQHAPCRAVSAMAIEGAAPSLSMCQMSICVHISLGVPGNETQLFTNEENWTRNDMDMPWL